MDLNFRQKSSNLSGCFWQLMRSHFYQPVPVKCALRMLSFISRSRSNFIWQNFQNFCWWVLRRVKIRLCLSHVIRVVEHKRASYTHVAPDMSFCSGLVTETQDNWSLYDTMYQLPKLCICSFNFCQNIDHAYVRKYSFYMRIKLTFTQWVCGKRWTSTAIMKDLISYF